MKATLTAVNKKSGNHYKNINLYINPINNCICMSAETDIGNLCTARPESCTFIFDGEIMTLAEALRLQGIKRNG